MARNRPPAIPLATLRELRDETRADLSRRLTRLSGLEAKVNQVMGLSTTMLAVVLAALSILANRATSVVAVAAAPWLTWTGGIAVTGGISAFLAAVVWSVAAYPRRDTPSGLSTEDIESVLQRGAHEANYLVAAVRSYVDGIRTLEGRTLEWGRHLKSTVLFFVAGISLVTLGLAILIGQVLRI